MNQPVCVGIVGLGNWGRNHVRTLVNLPECRLKYICDINPEAVATQNRLYPGVATTNDFNRLLEDPELEAVIVATSARSHYELSRRTLEAGKDLFVEKPMTLAVEAGEHLCELAERQGRLIQVGHLMLHHPAIEYLKRWIDSGDLGEIYYIYSQRLNLGVVRSDENALWSLAPHDFSISDHLMSDSPRAIHANGASYLQDRIEDVMFVTLEYSAERVAHVHVSWLDPHKIRRLTIVGSEKMAIFDDQEPTEKIRIYEKGVEQVELDHQGELLSIRNGDVHIPCLPNAEPLKRQMQHFMECVRTRRRPLVDGRNGLSVVRTLTEASRQLTGCPQPDPAHIQ